MPNIKSAKKRVLVTERNRVRNHAYKSAIRTAIKRAFEAIEQKADQTEVQARLDKTYSLIDRAILKGILHKNTGSRYKSRLTKASKRTSAA